MSMEQPKHPEQPTLSKEAFIEGKYRDMRTLPLVELKGERAEEKLKNILSDFLEEARRYDGKDFWYVADKLADLKTQELELSAEFDVLDRENLKKFFYDFILEAKAVRLEE